MDFSESERGKVIYLPPLEKDPDCIPILSLYFKLKETQSIAKLRVLLVRLDENRKPHGIYGIGFRMETPEKINQNASPSTNHQDTNTTNNSGASRFSPCTVSYENLAKMNIDNKLQIDCPIWLPQSQAFFPIASGMPSDTGAFACL